MTDTPDQQNQLRSILENMEISLSSIRESITWTNDIGEIQWCNASFGKLLGKSRQDILGKKIAEVLPLSRSKENLENNHPWHHAMAGRYIVRDEFELLRDENIYNLEISTSSLSLPIGKGAIFVIRDITEEKKVSRELEQAQMHLIQAEKMESVGRLAAGIAHEVKNPLAVIRLGISYFEKNISITSEESADVMKEVKDAIKRADGIIKGLMDLTAAESVVLVSASINKTIDQALFLVKHELDKKNIQLKKELDDRLPFIMIDRQKIEQVFINLFLNAVQAMSREGHLLVRSERKKLASAHYYTLKGRPQRIREGEEVALITVEDNGVGIPPNEIQKIFEPFFTTKAKLKGTGLGLSVSKQIIELHDASIRIENRFEGGARAQLVFRLSNKKGENRE